MRKGNRRSFLLCGLVVLLTGWSFSSFAQDGTARQLFDDKKSAIIQIRIIERSSGSKSAIGSGFVVDDSGLVATNYHVVQQAVSKPDQYRIEYLVDNGKRGELKLVDIDVINDLALVNTSDSFKQSVELAGEEPAKGESVYALGNPLDLGLTIVPGTYNGVSPASYYPRVHFTGSLNPGMSGGPTFDEKGRVVGVNVSTAGNQVSFLVPVLQLQKLVNDFLLRGAPVADFSERIRQQLMQDQKKKFAQMFQKDWQTMALGEAQVLKEMPPFVKCWGSSNSSSTEALFLRAARSCRSEDNIYLSSTFSSGIVEYEFFWLEADQLNSWQFYSYYQALFSDFIPGNKAGKEDVSDFVCEEGFVSSPDTGRLTKTVLCTRAYKEQLGLYDLFFLQGSVDESNKAFLSHFTLSGVSRGNGLDFTKKFMEVSQWQ